MVDRISWHYNEKKEVVIDDCPNGELYPFSLVIEFFPYPSSWWYKTIILDKTVSVVLNGFVSVSVEDEFERVLSGEVHQSKAITFMMAYCHMSRRDMQFIAAMTDKEKSAQGVSSPEWLVMQEKVAALEAALVDSRTENDKLRAENEELKNAPLRGGEAGENGQDEEFPAEYEDHGLFTVVAKLVYARTPVAEIMAALDEEKEFLSQRENGYFFHPNPTGKSVSTLRNYTKNTLKKRVAKGS